MESVYDMYRRGCELLDHGDYQAAIVPLSKARDLEPEKASIRETLGRALFHARYYARAAIEFHAVADRAPTDDYALFCLGRSMQLLGRHRVAVAVLVEQVAAARGLAVGKAGGQGQGGDGQELPETAADHHRHGGGPRHWRKSHQPSPMT